MKAIIFDCFGVLLVDKLKILLDEIRQQNPKKGRELTDILVANHRGFLDSNQTYALLAEGMGITPAVLKKTLKDAEVKNQALLSYILELRRNYKIGLLSNIGKHSLQKRFTSHELNQYFDAVVVSGEIGHAKPDPEAYQIVAERLGMIPSECLFTDDQKFFCQAAEAVGMKAIVFHGNAQFIAELTRYIGK